MINKVILAGEIGQYGVKISYTETVKPQTSFTLVCTEAGKSGGFKAFIPVLIVGPQAEPLAESLEPGDLVLLEGRLAYRKGKTKDSGRLEVVCFGVSRLASAAMTSNN
jgi:single-stranded DNA-binding protein